MSTKIRRMLFALIYGINLFLALLLWLCGIGGNILLGIILIIFYRLSLWFSPIAVTAVCWLPSRPRVSVRKRAVLNLVHLLGCAALFLVCRCAFGIWY